MTNPRRRAAADQSLFAFAALFLLTALTAGRAQDPEPSREEIDRIIAALPQSGGVEPEKPRKLLVFSVTRGYRHSAIPYGKKALEEMARKTRAFEAVITDDPAEFEPANLSRYDAVFLNNTNNEIFLPENVDKLSPQERKRAHARATALRESLARFVAEGKGLAVIHAGVASFRRWPEFGKIMGARFDNHPWNAGSTVTLSVEEPRHPVTRCFGGERFVVTDEIYQFKEYSRSNLRVLLSVDTDRTDMEKGERLHRTDGDFALAWVKPYGKGRVFYSALGHQHDIYWNPLVLRHLLAGIQFALGDLEADSAPRKPGRGDSRAKSPGDS